MEQYDHVYILNGKGTNSYKIGRTTDIVSRIESLRTGSPVEILVEGFYRVNNAVKVETYLHYKFQQYNTHLEWFDFSIDILTKLKNSLENIALPCKCSSYCDDKNDLEEQLRYISNKQVEELTLTKAPDKKDRTQLYNVSLEKTNDNLAPSMFVKEDVRPSLNKGYYKDYKYYSKRNAKS